MKTATRKDCRIVPTALREVLEETGVKGRIVAEIPGIFHGSTSANK